MFISKELVYLEMPKTACTHIKKLLGEIVEGESIGKHGRWDTQSKDRFVLGSVRNPWDWYISMWAFGCTRKDQGYFYRVLTSYNLKSVIFGRAPLFKPVKKWRELYSDSGNAENFRQWLKWLFDDKRGKDFQAKFTRHPIWKFAGLATFNYCRLHTDKFSNKINSYDELVSYMNEHEFLDAVVRTENLEEDLINALKSSPIEITAEQEAVILAGKGNKTNSSEHGSAADYYDEETKALVAERERFIIEKFGYGFPENK